MNLYEHTIIAKQSHSVIQLKSLKTKYSKIIEKNEGEIIKIDYSDVIKSEGVIDIITEKDIEGINDVGPVFKGDPIFTNRKIQYHGQPIFAVAATSYKLARKAASKVKIKLKEKKPILSIEEAVKKFYVEPKDVGIIFGSIGEKLKS